MAHASSGPDGDWWETGLVPALALTGTAVALSSTLWDATAGRSSHLQQLMHFETGLSDAGSYTEASLAAARQIAANALIRARRAVTVVTPACLGLGCWSGAQLGRSLQSCVAAVPNDAKDSPGAATTRARNALGNIFKVVGTVGGCLFGIVAGSSIAAATLATTAAFALNSARNQLILQGAKAALT